MSEEKRITFVKRGKDIFMITEKNFLAKDHEYRVENARQAIEAMLEITGIPQDCVVSFRKRKAID